ncbi:MAG: rRNA maturation RNase YbeY [Oligosphaeraceae bacterium]|nr:rRNA maturation RNase YbeY [Oligosphaeraceae bacterium]
MKIKLEYSADVPALSNEALFLELLHLAVPETGLQLNGGFLQLILLNVEDMAELNALHLGHTGSTDVISYDLRDAETWQALDDEEIAAAEIYICPAVIEENAALYGNSISAELLLCAIHGMLHLAGEDDQTEEKRRRMQRKQEEILAKIAPPDCTFI